MNESADTKAKAAMYFIAVVLPKHLDEKISLLKKQMHETYGCKVGLKSPAHITVVPPYWMEEAKEEALRSDMQRLAQRLVAFALSTNDFSAFKPRTIFVAVKDNAELNKLKNDTDQFFGASDYKMKLDKRPFHPHITIATRDLHKKDFCEAWQHFEKEEFKELFLANELSLLKHNGKTWDAIFTAPFKTAPAADPAAQS